MDKYEKRAVSRQKKRAKKERKKLMRSGKSICSKCGYIGRSKNRISGNWFVYVVHCIFGLPLLAALIVLCILEGFFRLLTLSKPQSIVWNSHFGKFVPHMPHKLHGCKDCNAKNSMRKLKHSDGMALYDRFKKDHFI